MRITQLFVLTYIIKSNYVHDDKVIQLLLIFFYFFKYLHLRVYGTLGVFMSFYNKLEEIFIVYRRVHLLNIKKCNNGVYIQPANLSFNKHLLLVENSPIDKHR